MNFSKLALGKRVAENVDPLAVQQTARDKALTGGERQQQGTGNLRQKQKQQASAKVIPQQSGTTFASEMRQIEVWKQCEKQASNWRDELKEAAVDEVDPHPYVDVMPPVDKKEKRLVAQAMQVMKQQKTGMGMKDAVKE